eukprot:363984-Chlamydomonas_euryale.AAC.24
MVRQECMDNCARCCAVSVCTHQILPSVPQPPPPPPEAFSSNVVCLSALRRTPLVWHSGCVGTCSIRRSDAI